MTFELIPSLFLFNGQCVHFPLGDYRRITVYPGDPLAVARKWIDAGATTLDVLDLNGARDGYPSNLELIGRLIRALDVPVQVGGGIRDLAIMETLIQAGARRLILGTAVVCDPHFVEEALVTYGDPIAIALETRQGRVAIRGDRELSVRGSQDVFQDMVRLGVRHFVYTDLGRNGTINYSEIRRLLNLHPNGCQVYVGGVASIQDVLGLVNLEAGGLAGAIIGQPLYSGQVSFDEVCWALVDNRLHSSYLPPVSDNSA